MKKEDFRKMSLQEQRAYLEGIGAFEGSPQFPSGKYQHTTFENPILALPKESQDKINGLIVKYFSDELKETEEKPEKTDKEKYGDEISKTKDEIKALEKKIGEMEGDEVGDEGEE